MALLSPSRVFLQSHELTAPLHLPPFKLDMFLAWHVKGWTKMALDLDLTVSKGLTQGV